MDIAVDYIVTHKMQSIKWGCVFPVVIWPAFRIGQYRVNDHPYHAPQLMSEFKL